MRRISRIEVQNFKSLVDFQIDLAKFSCLIGLNGSGKSTVLQFVDFLSRLVRGDMRGWLSERRWKAGDLKSKLSKKVNIEFSVHFADDQGRAAGCWEATYSPQKHHCVKESIATPDAKLEIVRDSVEIRQTAEGTATAYKIAFDYEGSILSGLKESLLPTSILACKRTIEWIESLDLLTPDHLRQRTRESFGTLGRGGRNLAAFLYEMGGQKWLDMVTRLKRAYPHLRQVYARSVRSGWKQLEVSEWYPTQGGGSSSAMTTDARHLNDGMLRVIAILAVLNSDNEFLLFDEIENGINPEVVEFVLDALTTARQQVMVTTHSPLILNYLEDEVAREGVIYLYRTDEGHTQAIRFFSIPSLAEKLKFMGPGEAFADTHLSALAEEITQVTERQ